MKGLLQFKWGRNQAQGTRFNYTELCPVLVAWALVSAYEQPLPLIFEQKIWQPLGAKDDATWLVDSKGFTFSGAGFSATLRDWARLGLLIANKGHAQGKQIIPVAWLDATSQHDENERAVKFNVARPKRGYKNFFWHHSQDGQILRMAGNHAQNMLIDRKTGTVLVQAAVSYEEGADEMMSELFEAACAI